MCMCYKRKNRALVIPCHRADRVQQINNTHSHCWWVWDSYCVVIEPISFIPCRPTKFEFTLCVTAVVPRTFSLKRYNRRGLVIVCFFSYMRDLCNFYRLAGAALLAPVVNYWWTGVPANLSSEAYYQLFQQDQWAVRVSHYTPWLTYFWNTQKWFPSSSVMAHSTDILSQQDKELLPKLLKRKPYMVCTIVFIVPCIVVLQYKTP